MLETANPMARLSVCCRDNTTTIGQLFRDHGFTNITAGAPMFEDFLDTAEPKAFRRGFAARNTGGRFTGSTLRVQKTP
jgi:hypothetical protein